MVLVENNKGGIALTKRGFTYYVQGVPEFSRVLLWIRSLSRDKHIYILQYEHRSEVNIYRQSVCMCFHANPQLINYLHYINKILYMWMWWQQNVGGKS